jgi:kynurenine formamidase
LGTLNFITPERVRDAAALVRSGRRVSMAIPINKVAGPDNPQQAMHFVVQSHDVPVDESKVGFALDYLGMACHGDCHTHVDALCHISYDGLTYNGRPAAEVVPSTGATAQDITAYATGVVGRGVLLDLPRLLDVPWLEPAEGIHAEDLEACAAKQGVTIRRGDIVLIRTGQLAQCRAEGSWGSYAGGSAPGLALDAAPWIHEHELAAIATDTWGMEVLPNETLDVYQPLHIILIVSMGLLVGEIFDLEALADDCAADGRYEFLFSAPPLPITGGVGSPVNPIAVK